MSTAALRQQRLKNKRRKAGFRLVRLWVSEEDIDLLKQRHPGPRGGVDWAAIVATATAAARPPEPPPLAPHTPSAEPFPYWKPDPLGPMDARCQARNRDGTRCRSKGKTIVKSLAPNGCLGEFNACERHQEMFQPHSSILARHTSG